MKIYQDYLTKIKPRVEAATGMNTSQEISPQRLKVYTTVGGAPNLDGGYTVFGKVIQGLDVVDKIAAVQKGPGGERPLEDIPMTVTVEKVPKKKIEELYGYKYEQK
jgi:peptidyl-prolyl cis-trans isomerase B (cyclophilin B)